MLAYLCNHDDHKVLLVYFVLLERCVIAQDFTWEEKRQMGVQ